MSLKPLKSVSSPAESANGLSLGGAWVRGANGSPALQLTAHNGSGATLHNFMVQFNKNAMALAPAAQVQSYGCSPFQM